MKWKWNVSWLRIHNSGVSTKFVFLFFAKRYIDRSIYTWSECIWLVYYSEWKKVEATHLGRGLSPRPRDYVFDDDMYLVFFNFFKSKSLRVIVKFHQNVSMKINKNAPTSPWLPCDLHSNRLSLTSRKVKRRWSHTWPPRELCPRVETGVVVKSEDTVGKSAKRDTWDSVLRHFLIGRWPLFFQGKNVSLKPGTMMIFYYIRIKKMRAPVRGENVTLKLWFTMKQVNLAK